MRCLAVTVANSGGVEKYFTRHGGSVWPNEPLRYPLMSGYSNGHRATMGGRMSKWLLIRHHSCCAMWIFEPYINCPRKLRVANCFKLPYQPLPYPHNPETTPIPKNPVHLSISNRKSWTTHSLFLSDPSFLAT